VLLKFDTKIIIIRKLEMNKYFSKYDDFGAKFGFKYNL